MQLLLLLLAGALLGPASVAALASVVGTVGATGVVVGLGVGLGVVLVMLQLLDVSVFTAKVSLMTSLESVLGRTKLGAGPPSHLTASFMNSASAGSVVSLVGLYVFRNSSCDALLLVYIVHRPPRRPTLTALPSSTLAYAAVGEPCEGPHGYASSTCSGAAARPVTVNE